MLGLKGFRYALKNTQPFARITYMGQNIKEWTD